MFRFITGRAGGFNPPNRSRLAIRDRDVYLRVSVLFPAQSERGTRHDHARHVTYTYRQLESDRTRSLVAIGTVVA